MGDFVEVKTAELTGPALDWTVAKCSGMPFFTMGEDWPGNYNVTVMAGEAPVLIYDLTGRMWREHQGITMPWSPSADWAQGGPLFDRYCSALNKSDTGWWAHADDRLGEGDTALVTLCRAIVAAELGDVVQVPAELVGVAA